MKLQRLGLNPRRKTSRLNRLSMLNTETGLGRRAGSILQLIGKGVPFTTGEPAGRGAKTEQATVAEVKPEADSEAKSDEDLLVLQHALRHCPAQGR
jgi:hypothetical protein